MLPVTLLTGFLGGGKTTLLQRLVQSPWSRGVGILMNERGIAGIDDVGPGASGFVELSEGCVCCVDQPDLVAALRAFSDRGDLHRVVVETTGLADPLPIAWTLQRPDLGELISLDAVVTVVDAANHAQTRTQEWISQVTAADLVVLSKLDLVDEAAAQAVRAAVREYNPSARILEGADGLLALVGPEALFGDGAQARWSQPSDRPVARHGDFTVVPIESREAVYDALSVEDLLEGLPRSVYRAKGVLPLAHVPGRDPLRRCWAAFHVVGGRVQLTLDVQTPAHGEARMAFFGASLDARALERAVEGCVIPAGLPAHEP